MHARWERAQKAKMRRNHIGISTKISSWSAQIWPKEYGKLLGRTPGRLFNTTTNQKQSAATEANTEGRCDEREAQKSAIPFLGGSEWNDKKINNKKYIVAFSNLRSKKIAQQPTKNRWAWGKRGWKGGTSVGEWQRDVNAPHLCVEGERGNVLHHWQSHDAGSWCWALRPQYGDDGIQNSSRAGPNIF